MTLNSPLARILLACALGLTTAMAHAGPPLTTHLPLTALPPITVPGGPGGFDWMLVDRAQNRLYATHGGTKTLTVLDLNTGAVRSVDAGAVSGVTVDSADGKVFTGGADQKVVILDNKTLEKTGEVAVTGPVDDIKYDPENGLVYAAHDDGAEDWVINAKTGTLVGTIPLPGAPEAFALDAGAGRLYQNIKPADCVDVIDPATNRVIAVWPTLPAKSPHGLVIDDATGRLFSAGGNGVLAVFSLKTGKVVASAAIAPGTDQIAFDPKRRRIYCASRGFVSVVQETASGGVRSLGAVPAPRGAHTLALDPLTGDVWVSYSDATASHLQRFTVSR